MAAWGFPRAGNSPPALRRSPSPPKVWRALWDAVGDCLGPRRRCRDAGAPLTPAEPPPPGGRIRHSGGRRPAPAASAPNCALGSEDAGAVLPTAPALRPRLVRGGRHGQAGPLAGREAAPGGRCQSCRRTIRPTHDSDPASDRRRLPEPQPKLWEPRASPPDSPLTPHAHPATWGRLVKLARPPTRPLEEDGGGGGLRDEGGAGRKGSSPPIPPPPGSLALLDPSVGLCSRLSCVPGDLLGLLHSYP